MYWSIDRIEKEIAVIENEGGHTLEVPLSFLPHGIKEGDLLEVQISKEERARREKKIATLMKNVWADD